MSTTRYDIRLVLPNTRLAVWYRGGQLHRWQLAAGKLQESWYSELYRVIPFYEEQMEQYKSLHMGTVEYLPARQKPQSMYHQYVSVWFAFYRKLAGVEPKFGGSEGKALKQVIGYLEGVSAHPSDALALWQHILESWPRLDAFTRGKPQITYISAHFNSIIIQLKHGQTGSNKTRTDADDLRRSI